MGERYMTMAEIEAAYPNEWVLLAEPTHAKRGDVTGGRVVWHHPDQAEFNRRLIEHRHPKVAIRYAGLALANPDDVDVISVWTSDSTPG